MELQERNETKLKEASPSKLHAAEAVFQESKSLLEDVNTLNMTNEEEEKQSTSSMEVGFLLTPRQQRKWKNLSEKRKQRYFSKTFGRLNNESAEKENTVQLHVKKEASIPQKSTKQSILNETTGIGTNKTLPAHAAVRKTADKFKESFLKKEAEQAEGIQQFQRQAETQRPEKRQGKRPAGVGKILSGTAGAVTAAIKVRGASLAISVLPFLGVLVPIVLAGILLITVVCFICVFSAGADTGTGSNQIVQVAQTELAFAEQNIGGRKYKEWYGLDGDWCAMFVSWCGNECGFIEDGIMVKSASVRNTKSWFEEKNLYQTKESGYIPKEGDLVFFLNGISHIGIVVSYDLSTDQITVIEGNSGSSSATPYHEGSRVTQNVYQRTAQTISGYGTPDYPDVEGSTENNEENLLTGGENP